MIHRINRYLFRLVIAFQIVFLASGAVYFGRSRSPLAFDQDSLLIARNNIAEQQGFYVDTSYDGTGHRISTPVFRLSKGIYEAAVSYHVENEDQFRDYSRVVPVPDGLTASFPISDRIEESYGVLCDKIPLRDYQPDISYRFHINAPDLPVTLICYLDSIKENASESTDSAEEHKWVLVRSVEIKYLSAVSTARFLVQWLTIFLLLDIIYAGYKKRSVVLPLIRQYKWTAFLLLLIFVLAEIPMLLPYIPKGGDLFFHMLRLGGLAQGLADGSFPVKIQPIWNNNYGDAVGVMYGDLLLVIPALLYNLGFTIDFAYKFYIFLINAGTIATCYICGKHLFKTQKATILGTAFYVLSPFRLCDLYARAAVGEHTAMMFLPIIVLGVYLIYYSTDADLQNSRLTEHSWIILALGYFGIVTSHVLSIIMVTAYLGLFALLNYKKTMSKRVFTDIVKAALLALLLSAYFLIPFVDYYIHVPMKVTNGARGIYSSSAATLPQIFGLPLEREPHQASPLYGVIIIAACILFFKKKGVRPKKGFGSVLLLAILSIWLSSNLFPYALVNHLIPFLYQKRLESMQFPWRWLTLSSVLCYLLLGWCVDHLYEYFIQEKIRSLLCILIGAIICCQSYVYTDILCRDSEPYDYMNVCVTNAWGWAYEIQREYAFRNLQVDAVYSTEIEHDESVLISAVKRNDLEFMLNLKNEGEEDSRLIFPVFNYKGYRATLSDGTEIPVEIGPYHKVQITAPADASWEGLHVYFSEPISWRVAEIVSLITALALSIYCSSKLAVRGRRKNVNVSL